MKQIVMEITSKVLYKVHQHPLIMFFKIAKAMFAWALPLSLIVLFVTNFSVILFSITFILLSAVIYYYYFFFWNNSYFLIYNDKLWISVRNWFFSKFDMSLQFRNIKDTAYAKNHLLHFTFDYWTFFARSSAWAAWDFEAPELPGVEKIYKYVNFILSLNEIERYKLNSLDDKIIADYYLNPKSPEEIISMEIDNLKKITWIKEVIKLNTEDRNFIFDNEEDRNHWVYETLKRDVVLCFTHDAAFRDPDAPIVIKNWSKVIFPPVSFHEIKRKNVVSSSPSLKVHNYLLKYFENLDKDDATVFVWFDL